MKRPRLSERDFLRHYARVLLTQARIRRGQEFAAVLLDWARNARTRSNAQRAPQLDLFGRSA